MRVRLSLPFAVGRSAERPGCPRFPALPVSAV